MEAKRFVVALTVSVAAGLLWYFVVGPKLLGRFPTTQPDDGTATSQKDQPGSATQPATQPASEPAAPTPTTAPAVPAATVTVRPSVPSPDEPETWTLGSLDQPEDASRPHYRMAVTVAAKGAGVRDAKLAEYFVTAGSEEHYTVIAPPADGQPPALAAASVRLDSLPGSPAVSLSDVRWTMTGRDQSDESQSISFRVELAGEGGKPLLAVEKTFKLSKGADEAEASGYDLAVSYRLINLSGGPLEASLSGTGAELLVQEDIRSDNRTAHWGHGSEGKDVLVSYESRQTVVEKPDKAKLPATTDEDGLAWAAAANKFFAVVIRPVEPRKQPLNFRFEPTGNNAKESLFRVQWDSGKLALPAGGPPVSLGFADFLGPKDHRLFGSRMEYKRLAYGGLITYRGCCTNQCSFGWLSEFMLWLLDKLHAVVRNYGIAIMILVAVVRICLHPLTKKSQVSMSKMSKLQPKMEELKKQYGDNKAELNKAMAEFYREQGFTPILGCLPMLLQMPIWIALWGGLMSAIELRQAPFFGWINDLAAPDCLYAWTTPANGYRLPLIGDALTGPIYSLNLLPLLLVVAMFFQQLLTPKPASGPQAKQQRNMMYFMTIFFGLIFYGMPSGLTLYVMASTAVGAGEQYVIRKHIREKEAAEAAGVPTAKAGKSAPTPAGPGYRPRGKGKRH